MVVEVVVLALAVMEMDSQGVRVAEAAGIHLLVEQGLLGRVMVGVVQQDLQLKGWDPLMVLAAAVVEVVTTMVALVVRVQSIQLQDPILDN